MSNFSKKFPGFSRFSKTFKKKQCFSRFSRICGNPGLLELLNLGLEGIAEVDTDSKGRCVSFKVTPCNERVLCVYASLGGLQNYVENENEKNEIKIILGDFNCTMVKMDKDGENKTQRLHRCCSNYALSRLIVDNGLEDL